VTPVRVHVEFDVADDDIAHPGARSFVDVVPGGGALVACGRPDRVS